MGNRGEVQELEFKLSGKFEQKFDQRKQNLVRVSGGFQVI